MALFTRGCYVQKPGSDQSAPPIQSHFDDLQYGECNTGGYCTPCLVSNYYYWTNTKHNQSPQYVSAAHFEILVKQPGLEATPNVCLSFATQLVRVDSTARWGTLCNLSRRTWLMRAVEPAASCGQKKQMMRTVPTEGNLGTRMSCNI